MHKSCTAIIAFGAALLSGSASSHGSSGAAPQFKRENIGSAPCPAIYAASPGAFAAFMVLSVEPPVADSIKPAPVGFFRYTETNQHPFQQISLQWPEIDLGLPKVKYPRLMSFSIQVRGKYPHKIQLQNEFGEYELTPQKTSIGKIRHISFQLNSDEQISIFSRKSTIKMAFVNKNNQIFDKHILNFENNSFSKYFHKIFELYIREFHNFSICKFIAEEDDIT